MVDDFDKKKFGKRLSNQNLRKKLELQRNIKVVLKQAKIIPLRN